MIRLQDLKITFNKNTVIEKKAIQGITLNIEEGNFITVIGSNGAGKSTLLNAIAGDVLPSDGKIYIDDEDVSNKYAYMRSHAVARVFQDPLVGTCGDLTIAENMALALKRGSCRSFKRALLKPLREEFAHILSRLNLGLENRLDTSMNMLSGGQRQAVSLLMATLSPLKILLLDEHTSALDPKTADYVLNLTQDIVSEKKLTVLMVTHSLNHALQMGNRTIILHEGKLLFDVNGNERTSLTIEDLLSHFGSKVDDDRLLLQQKKDV
ncbi:MAG: ATP-binding cassette domain-containing protein [Proteobacteria bacterium]|nr:ATP-binding cassette domain-containing protein [Pseudomonadota bacterium]